MEFREPVLDIVSYDGVNSVRASLRSCAKRWPGWFPKFGAVFGGCYRVRGVLAESEMGVVLLALDLRLEREVAIKIIHPDSVMNPEARDRLLAEARAMARVRHENVVEIFAFDDHEGSPFFTMEFIPGQHVASWRDALGGAAVTVDEAIGILDQVCRGVTAIHRAGAVHRDLRWSNVLLGPAFRVCVTDLGFTQVSQRAPTPVGLLRPSPYSAPETLDDAMEAEPSSDVYSLGVMAYELLTGQLPAQAELAPSALDPLLEQALRRACAPEPSRRTPTPEDFRRELHEARRSMGGVVSMRQRFVVADDDDDFVDLIAALLESAFEGCEVVRVSNGEAALLAVGPDVPDLVVLDLDMPGINGIELTSLFRMEPSLSQMPIIVATASGGAPDWRLLRSLGADGFVVKPVDPLAFVALARRTLGYAATMRPSALQI